MKEVTSKIPVLALLLVLLFVLISYRDSLKDTNMRIEQAEFEILTLKYRLDHCEQEGGK